MDAKLVICAETTKNIRYTPLFSKETYLISANYLLRVIFSLFFFADGLTFSYLCSLFKYKIMKKVNIFAALATASTFMVLSSCGMGSNGSLLGTNSTGYSQTSSLLGTQGSQIGSLANLIGGVIGALTNTSSSIVGTWVYTGPAVEFQSDNFLAQAGGAVAGQQVASKIQPYFEKLGIKAGAVTMTFNSDNTCTYTANGKTYNGTYKYDQSANSLQIVGATSAINFPACNVSVGANNLNITFKTSALLSAVQGVGSKSNNSTLSTISTLAQQFSGMQTGFQFTRQ